MWKGIQTLADYKKVNIALSIRNYSFPEELNISYDQGNAGQGTIKADLPSSCLLLIIPSNDVCSTLSKVNSHKTVPDGIPCSVLKACVEQLAEVFTDIFTLSITQTVFTAHFKTETTVPVPKYAMTLNSFHPVDLMHIIGKCLERLILCHLKSCLPSSMNLYKFAYHLNRSTEDAVTMALHSALTHLDNSNSYIKMPFVDLFTQFNSHMSTLVLTSGIPQIYVLNHLFYFLFTHECILVHGSNSTIKFADDTMVVALIRDNDKMVYRQEVKHLTMCYADHNCPSTPRRLRSSLYTTSRPRGTTWTYVWVFNGAEVEQVAGFKFPGVYIPEDLTWAINTSTLINNSCQCLYSMRRLRKAHLLRFTQIVKLVNFYHCTIKSILEKNASQCYMEAAQSLTGKPSNWWWKPLYTSLVPSYPPLQTSITDIV